MESRNRRRGPRSLGRRAEALALRWLTSQGLRPVTRNFRCRYGEVDLVMRDGDVLVFIEVRCRQGRSLTRAALTVERKKQQRLARTALFFIARHEHYAGLPMRFDVVGFDRAPDRHAPDAWIRNAFEPNLSGYN